MEESAPFLFGYLVEGEVSPIKSLQIERLTR